MDLLKKVIIELRFDDMASAPTTDMWSELIRSLSKDGKMPESIPPQQGTQQGLIINIKDKSTKVVVEPNRCALSIDKITTQEELKYFVDDAFTKIVNVMKWNKLFRIGVRTYWVKEYEGNFMDLTSLIRKTIFTDNELINESVDVALPLTFKDNGNRINYVFGPMEKEQLSQQFFSENQVELPDVSTFTDIDYIKIIDGEYSSEALKETFDLAINYAIKKSRVTHNLLFKK